MSWNGPKIYDIRCSGLWVNHPSIHSFIHYTNIIIVSYRITELIHVNWVGPCDLDLWVTFLPTNRVNIYTYEVALAARRRVGCGLKEQTGSVSWPEATKRGYLQCLLSSLLGYVWVCLFTLMLFYFATVCVLSLGCYRAPLCVSAVFAVAWCPSVCHVSGLYPDCWRYRQTYVSAR